MAYEPWPQLSFSLFTKMVDIPYTLEEVYANQWGRRPWPVGFAQVSLQAGRGLSDCALFLADQNKLEICAYQTGEPVASLSLPELEKTLCRSFKQSARGSRFLVELSDEGRAIIFALPSGERIRSLKCHSAALTPDGRLLAHKLYQGPIQVEETDSGRPLATIQCGRGGLSELRFLSANLLSGQDKLHLRIWDLGSGEAKEVGTFPFPGNWEKASLTLNGRWAAYPREVTSQTSAVQLVELPRF